VGERRRGRRSHNRRSTPEGAIRRVCFDIEAEYIRELKFQWLNGDEMRAFLRGRKVSVIAAVTFDEAANTFDWYSGKDMDLLGHSLSEADEIISFNGERWDLPIIESCQRKRSLVKRLQSVRHHDLQTISGVYALDQLVALNFASNRISEWVRQTEKQKQQLIRQGRNGYLAMKLSKAWLDVVCTFALWSRHCAGELVTRR